MMKLTFGTPLVLPEEADYCMLSRGGPRRNYGQIAYWCRTHRIMLISISFGHSTSLEPRETYGQTTRMLPAHAQSWLDTLPSPSPCQFIFHSVARCL